MRASARFILYDEMQKECVRRVNVNVNVQSNVVVSNDLGMRNYFEISEILIKRIRIERVKHCESA